MERQKSGDNYKDQYESTLIELEQTKHKLTLKDEEIQRFTKIRQIYNSEENKTGNLTKQIKSLENRLTEAQGLFKNLLVKVEQEEHKYKELNQKLVEDSELYLKFIKKLQDSNEEITQRHLKAKKLLRSHKVKFNDEDTGEREPYSILKQYIEKEILSQVTKVLIPQFQAKLQQKVAAVETELTAKYKKLLQVKHAVQVAKSRNTIKK